jgi:hypothetical protein
MGTSLLACSLALSLLAPSPLAAQTKKAADSPDQKELLAYVLTMDKIHHLADATKELKGWQDKNPQAAKELEENQLGDSADINEQAKLLESKFPQAVAIVKKHGFATREYLVALYAYIESVTIVAIKKSGQPPDPSRVNGVVNPANLALIEKNWEEIQKLNASFNNSGNQ